VGALGYPRLPDQTGRVYGRLTIISETEKVNGKRFFLCKCECGNVGIHRFEDIRAGKILSCGCYNIEKGIKHGRSGTRIYNVWKGIVYRCSNPLCGSYIDYGGRGIKICAEWLNVDIFCEWAARNGYKNGLTIERMDVNGNYEPNNCTWIPLARQASNTRRNRKITYEGKTMILRDWAKHFGIKYATLKNRFHLGWSIEKALKTPLDYTRKKKVFK
jgi:hypothetical protein